jgi:drug/metabolite transporter (DMT)-like permease
MLSKVLPLLGGMVYVFAALFLKRASELGANVWRTVRLCNFATAVAFAPLLVLGGTIPSWTQWAQPALVALFFVAGHLCTLRALQVGDVSVATPVMGVKIPLVALLTTVLLGEHISGNLWMAAILSSAAIALLNITGRHPHHRVGATVLLAALAATAYALCDVLVQRWSPQWGVGRFLPLTMALVGVYSFALGPFDAAPKGPTNTAARSARPWVWSGAACLALQAVMFVSSIAVYGRATEANVLYSWRGLWSVILVWAAGHWFGNRERGLGPRVMAWRLVGAALLLTAIVIVVRRPG